VAPSSAGLFQRATNKGESGFGKASEIKPAPKPKKKPATELSRRVLSVEEEEGGGRQCC